MTAKQKKKPATRPSVDVGELIRQPHGGALRRGGAEGTTNKGGPGRPKDAFRQACRDAFNDVWWRWGRCRAAFRSVTTTCRWYT